MLVFSITENANFIFSCSCKPNLGMMHFFSFPLRVNPIRKYLNFCLQNMPGSPVTSYYFLPTCHHLSDTYHLCDSPGLLQELLGIWLLSLAQVVCSLHITHSGLAISFRYYLSLKTLHRLSISLKIKDNFLIMTY